MAEQTNLPSIPPPNEKNLVAFARAVKEALEVRLGRRGQGLDAAVTFRDLDKVQMVQGDGRGGVAALRPPPPIGAGYDPTLDTTPPPAPTGVKASGAVRNIILEWDGPPSTYRNPAYAEIWRSSTNNLNDAAQVGQSGSTMYVDNVGEGKAHYYWIRYVSQANVTGPWSAAGNAGAQGATSLDVSYTLGLLTSNGFGDPSSQSPFVQLDAPVTINGVEVPAGTYLHQAWVANGTITRLKVGDAAIDDAKVANLSAAKLTAGDGTIGGILKSANYVSGLSGWAVHPSGWAEFANATVRGTIYADTGWFKGQIIGGNATSYAAGTGMWTGVDDGVWKFRLGSSASYMRWDGASITLRGTLTIEDGDGNVLLSSGIGVPWDRISGKTGFAAISQITPSNVTTYIANAAIGNAQIANAAIGTAQIGYAQVDTLRIGENAVTVPVTYTSTAALTLALGTWNTIGSAYINPEGAVVFVHAFAQFSNYDEYDSPLYLRVVSPSGNVIVAASRPVTSFINWTTTNALSVGSVSISGAFSETGTYTIQMHPGNHKSCAANHRAILLLAGKR